MLLDLTPEGREAPPAPRDVRGRGTERFGDAGPGAARDPALSPARANGPALDAAEPRGDAPASGTAGCKEPRAGERSVRPNASPPSVEVLERVNLTPPRTSFNGRVSAHRRFAFGQLSLDDVKAVKNEYGYTVNDVVMAICAGAVRRWIVEREELPDTPLVTQVPVSVRSEEQRGTYGNRIGVMSARYSPMRRTPSSVCG